MLESNFYTGLYEGVRVDSMLRKDFGMEDEYVDVAVETAEMITPQTATNIVKRKGDGMGHAVGVGVLVTALYSGVSWGVTTGLEWLKDKRAERKAHKDAEKRAQRVIKERYDDKVETL